MSGNIFEICGYKVKPGENTIVELSVANLYSHTPVNVPVHVMRGKRRGPSLFVMATLHGDEINSVEIVRRLVKHSRLKHLKGTLIVVPIANIYGFMTTSRYLPDRRDLNRSFPGLEGGSMTARLANLFMKEIVSKCDYGIDLHSASVNRINLPHVRIDPDMEITREMAIAFNLPLILHTKLKDGSLRQACNDLGIPLLVYEGGEGLRFDEVSVRAGMRGVIGVMEYIGMLSVSKKKRQVKYTITESTTWIRAPESGIIHIQAHLGDEVKINDLMGIIVDPVGNNETPVYSTENGIVISNTTIPLVHEGDAIFHVALLKKLSRVIPEVDALQKLSTSNSSRFFDTINMDKD